MKFDTTLGSISQKKTPGRPKKCPKMLILLIFQQKRSNSSVFKGYEPFSVFSDIAKTRQDLVGTRVVLLN